MNTTASCGEQPTTLCLLTTASQSALNYIPGLCNLTAYCTKLMRYPLPYLASYFVVLFFTGYLTRTLERCFPVLAATRNRRPDLPTPLEVAVFFALFGYAVSITPCYHNSTVDEPFRDSCLLDCARYTVWWCVAFAGLCFVVCAAIMVVRAWCWTYAAVVTTRQEAGVHSGEKTGAHETIVKDLEAGEGTEK